MNEIRFCDVCGKEIIRQRGKWSKNCRTTCSHSCSGKLTNPSRLPIAERFWSKVEIMQPDDCWIWTGAIVKKYGEFAMNGKIQSAHRVSWQLTSGTIPEGMNVLHHCDNPPCVNPKHLFLGTNTDNMQDALRKGRLNPRTGESCSWSKLKENDVREIRIAYNNGVNYSQLSRKYLVASKTIINIINGKNWRCVV
jgi:hypothetical protein